MRSPVRAWARASVAEQNARDYEALAAAVESGRVTAETGL